MDQIFDVLFQSGGNALHIILGGVLCVAGGYMLFSAKSVAAKVLGFILLVGGLIVGWPFIRDVLGL